MHARASENIIKKRREEVLTVVHARLRLFCRSIKEPAGRRSIFWQAGSRRASMIGTPGITSPRGRPTRPASKSAPVCLVLVTSGGASQAPRRSLGLTYGRVTESAFRVTDARRVDGSTSEMRVGGVGRRSRDGRQRDSATHDPNPATLTHLGAPRPPVRYPPFRTFRNTVPSRAVRNVPREWET